MRLFIKFVVVSKCKRTLTENMQYLLYITKKQKKKSKQNEGDRYSKSKWV